MLATLKDSSSHSHIMFYLQVVSYHRITSIMIQVNSCDSFSHRVAALIGQFPSFGSSNYGVASIKRQLNSQDTFTFRLATLIQLLPSLGSFIYMLATLKDSSTHRVATLKAPLIGQLHSQGSSTHRVTTLIGQLHSQGSYT